MRLFLIAGLLFAAAPALAAQEPVGVDTGRVYTLDEVTERPRPTNAPELLDTLQARYPADLAGGRSGEVEVAIVIGTDGAPRDVQVVRSSDPAFDAATVAALRVLRFSPASWDGHPVAVRVTLPIRWVPAPARVEPDETLAAEPADPDSMHAYDLLEVTDEPRIRNVSALLRQLERLYPPHLRDTRQHGIVQTRIRVNAQGEPSRIVIVRSSHPDFTGPTLQALRTLRFSPARLNGRPVAVWVDLPIQWTVAAPTPAPLRRDGAP